jgi:DHA1 family bicyclomycin/chloramphenicol resistance-like MFS transporter
MNEKLLKALLILLVCIPMASTDIFIPALPIMVTDLNTTLVTIGLVLSSYMLGFSVSILTTGALSDIYGRKKVLIYSMSLYLISCLLIVFCHNIYFLIGLRFLQGLGGGSGTVVGRLVLKDYFPPQEQVNVMSILSTGMALSPAIAPQIGAICTTYFNWQSCFLVTFIIAGFILWVLIFKFQETNHNLTTLNPIKQLPFSLLQAFNTKEFIGFTLLISFAWCAYFNFIGLSSFLFQKEYLYSEHQYALVIGIVTIGYLLGTTFTRVLNHKQFSLHRIIKIGVISCLSASVLLLIAYSLKFSLLLIVAMAIIRFGIGLIMPTAQVGALRLHATNVGWYMGCLFFVEFILGSVTLYLAGLIETIKLGGGIMACIMVSSLLLLLGVKLIGRGTINYSSI